MATSDSAHTCPGEATLVLFSGGRDSTTCLFWTKKHFDSVRAVGFDYGQKHRVELEQAQKIAEEAEVPFTVLDTEEILEGPALTEHDKDVSLAFILRGRSCTFIGEDSLVLGVDFASSSPGTRGLTSFASSAVDFDFTDPCTGR